MGWFLALTTGLTLGLAAFLAGSGDMGFALTETTGFAACLFFAGEVGFALTGAAGFAAGLFFAGGKGFPLALPAAGFVERTDLDAFAGLAVFTGFTGLETLTGLLALTGFESLSGFFASAFGLDFAAEGLAAVLPDLDVPDLGLGFPELAFDVLPGPTALALAFTTFLEEDPALAFAAFFSVAGEELVRLFFLPLS